MCLRFKLYGLHTHTHTRIAWILGFLPSSFVCPADSFLVYSLDFVGLWHPDHKTVLPSYTFLPLCLDLSFSLCLISHVIGNWFKFLQVNASGQFCGEAEMVGPKWLQKEHKLQAARRWGGLLIDCWVGECKLVMWSTSRIE